MRNNSKSRETRNSINDAVISGTRHLLELHKQHTPWTSSANLKWERASLSLWENPGRASDVRGASRHSTLGTDFAQGLTPGALALTVATLWHLGFPLAAVWRTTLVFFSAVRGPAASAELEERWRQPCGRIWPSSWIRAALIKIWRASEYFPRSWEVRREAIDLF